MNRTLLASAALALALPLLAAAQPSVNANTTQTHYSRQELHHLMQDAHTAQQYQTLADYFRQRESFYRSEAASELVERDRRAAYTMGVAQKYPRPVDSAQYLYQSYVQDAEQNATLAKHYEELASSAPKA